MNINGYIKKYGDKTFREMPFNEIDSLILSQLVYMNFDEYAPSINELDKHLHRLKSLVIKDRKKFYSSTVTPIPMKQMVDLLIKSRRYANILYGYIESKFDHEEVAQFYAMTFFLPNGKIYIAYRGTDTSLLGWKEDFLITYMDEIVSQRMAVAYAKKILNAFPQNCYIGGHSKGGNLAMYTLLKIGKKYEGRVEKVYSFDGPGFRCGKEGFESFDRVESKFDKYLTQNDLIGMVYLMTNSTKIVKSDAFLLGGHDPFGWQIKNNAPEFVYCRDRSNSSKIVVEALENWLDNLSIDDKKLIIDAFFEVFKDVKTVNDLLILGAKDIIFSKKTLQKYTKVEQVKLKTFFDNFIHYYMEAFFTKRETKPKPQPIKMKEKKK